MRVMVAMNLCREKSHLFNKTSHIEKTFASEPKVLLFYPQMNTDKLR